MRYYLTSTSNQYYTPLWLLAVLRSIIHIDLDPASDWFGNKRVKADMYMTDHGSTHGWYAKSVFCTPPYGKVLNMSQASIFLQHAIKQVFEYKNCVNVIMLLKCAHGYKWFQEALNFPHCVLNAKLAFSTQTSKQEDRCPHGSIILCISRSQSTIQKFVEVMSEHGTIPGYNAWAH